MALKASSTNNQGLTPPDSPTKGMATSPAIVKDLKHLFGVFLENALLDLTNQEPPSAPVSHDQSLPGLDMARLKQLMVELTHDDCASAELSLATKPAQSCSASNEQEENVPRPDGLDFNHPICTTPDDFESFKKWASTPQFTTVVEMYEPPPPIPFSIQKVSDAGIAGTKKHVNTRSQNRWRPVVVRTTMLNMHSLSVSVWVRNVVAQVPKPMLIA